MHPLNQPLRFATWFRPAAWGGHALDRFAGKRLPEGEPIGESWEVSDHPLHRSVVATGPLRGTTLRALMASQSAELLGSDTERPSAFPWLIKLLDADGWLSVQVHPDAEAVRRLLPGEGPKSEAWLVLDARPEGRIYAGLLPGVGPVELCAALEAGRVAECLHRFVPRPGEVIYLPAGTVHAVGGGVLLAEVQQTSDATFRLYDWDRRDALGRPRPLHVEAGLASIDWRQGPVQPIPATAEGELLRSPHFTLSRLRHEGSFALGGGERLHALIVTEGRGRFENGEPIRAGEVWLLPAVMPAMAVHPDEELAGLLIGSSPVV